MNIEQYIESGIIEQYVLGDVSPQEKQEVECMSHIYPEIKAELQSQQEAIEKYAMMLQVKPPDDLKAKILSKVAEVNAEYLSADNSGTSDNVTQEARIINLAPATEKENIVKMDVPTGNSYTRYIAAASLVLCVVLAGLNFYNSNKYKDQISQISGSNASMEEHMKLLSDKMAIMQDPSYKKITMAGVKEKSPESVATVFWNQHENAVFINPNNLPHPEKGKQFQLWAIRDGVPVDIGMLPNDFDANSLVKMNNIDNAQAFAITMEKEGGVPSPTMSEMYVIATL